MIAWVGLLAVMVSGCQNKTSKSDSSFDQSKQQDIQSSNSTKTKAENKDLQKFSTSFTDLFDTATQVIGFTDSQEEFDHYADLIYQTMWEYHQLFDIYHLYDGINNIKTINDNAGKQPVQVDDRLIDMLDQAIEAEQTMKGKMNIAFGSVLSVWHDYREQGLADPNKAVLPPVEELKKKAEYADLSKVVIDHQKKTAFLPDKEMKLDVGAIAKGYATEKTAQMIEEAGLTQAMLSVGGNIRVIGRKIGEQGEELPWSVGIQNPDISAVEPTVKVLALQGKQSLVTSGIYERFFTVNGKNYHHIIDPETLFPSERYLSVSIVCEDSGLADALSTALFNMELSEGQELISSLDGVEACWILPNNTIEVSDGFSKFEK